ncbi:MAG: FAD:protein FMN transferase [Planctomycetia bacterium]|nr:FAD:protein FMN transferase [Planctomycetia bacterium]
MSAAPRSTRRDFLQGKTAVDAMAELALGGAPAELPPPTSATYLVQLARRAMACKFEVFLNAGQYQRDTEAALAALDLVDRVEGQLSVFRNQSEISRLNRLAAHGPVVVEPRLFALIDQAVQLHAATHGAYDITSGPLSRAWGFMRRSGSIPDAETLAAARDCVGSQYLKLDRADNSVHFLRPGLEINLGSIGKGYALDRCGELLAAEGIHDFLLHGGNSSVLARGAHGSLPSDQGWSVGVRNPLRPDRRLGELRLNDRALATSGSGTQFFIHDGRRYGHILDPRSGWPAEGVLSVTVLAPTAAEADALSTAFYVLGPQLSQDYCAAHPQVAAVMFCPGTRQRSLDRHFFGLDERDWTALDEP